MTKEETDTINECIVLIADGHFYSDTDMILEAKRKLEELLESEDARM